MDIALHIPVQDSPLSLVSQTKPSVSLFTKHLLRIDSYDHVPDHENIQETIYFTSVDLSGALQHVKADQVVDAILVNSQNLSDHSIALKNLAKEKSIPFIIYSSKFEQAAKDLALKFGADEYHHGEITYSFLKRVEFIKKLKDYKNQRGNKPYVSIQAHEEIPQIKLWASKRAFDIILSAFGLLCISPLLIIIAILIKFESKGPIFYISKRAGAGYKIFDFYKFRSMRVGAAEELKKLEHLNQYSENSANGVFFKIKNDPRVTRIGNFLRSTSLDEIPQLINVLKGDMSLVGNRPLPLYEAEKLTKDQIAWRFLAPAGITGLWQVTKRGKEDMSPEERIALDMEYAMKNSFWLDVKILMSTFPALLQKEKV